MEPVYLRVEGESVEVMSWIMPPEDETSFAIRNTILQRQDPSKADSLKVQLLTGRQEQYTPPRCRKPRTRTIKSVAKEWTLGELRRLSPIPGRSTGAT